MEIFGALILIIPVVAVVVVVRNICANSDFFSDLMKIGFTIICYIIVFYLIVIFFMVLMFSG